MRERQRQAEKTSNHRRSCATKRPLPEGGSLSVEERRQLGKDIKGDDLFTIPSSDGACVFESAQKRSGRKELGGSSPPRICPEGCGSKNSAVSGAPDLNKFKDMDSMNIGW